MAIQQHSPSLNRTLIFFHCQPSTIVYNLAERENPAACAPNGQIVPPLFLVARRWAVASAQPLEALC